MPGVMPNAVSRMASRGLIAGIVTFLLAAIALYVFARQSGGEAEPVSIFGWALFGAGAAGAWACFSQRRIERQVNEAIDALDRVSRGDFSPPLADDAGTDEWNRLRKQVNVTSVRLRSMIEQLGSLAEFVSHELGSAVGRVQARIEKIADASDLASAQDLARIAMTETARVRGSVQALLELNSISAGTMHRFVRLDLNRIARDVAEMFATTAEDRGLELLSRLASAEILGDKNLIVQLLANLVDNALKYTPSGGSIEIEIRTAGSEVILSVSDTGPGIPKAMRDRMLEPAQRLERDQDKPGYGYGLAVVDAIARRHGGAMKLLDVEKGLRVEIAIPRFISATQAPLPNSSRDLNR
jgi:signal transduction histidine kinase